jgi:hypothetical protein
MSRVGDFSDRSGAGGAGGYDVVHSDYSSPVGLPVVMGRPSNKEDVRSMARIINARAENRILNNAGVNGEFLRIRDLLRPQDILNDMNHLIESERLINQQYLRANETGIRPPRFATPAYELFGDDLVRARRKYNNFFSTQRGCSLM